MVKKFSVFIVLFLLGVSNSQAGSYSDALGQCFIKNTSPEEKNKLIVWVFSAASQHPVVKDMISVTEAQLNKANKDFADLTMKLLTLDCKSEAKQAVNKEGISALQASFTMFGEEAGQALFTSPSVVKSMAAYVRYLDVIQLGLMFR